MDFNKLFSGIAGSGLVSGLAGGVAGGALTSAMMSKKGRKLATNVAAIGGLAAVGGLAWKAYQGYRDSQPAANPIEALPELVRREPAQPTAASHWQGLSQNAFAIDAVDTSQGSRGLVLIRAMIAAANADGHIDAAEKERIFAKVQTLALSNEEKALLFDELSAPADLERVIADVNDPETAIEVYVASMMAIDSTTEHGGVYLGALAHRLAIPAPLLKEIYQQSAGHVQAA